MLDVKYDWTRQRYTRKHLVQMVYYLKTEEEFDHTMREILQGRRIAHCYQVERRGKSISTIRSEEANMHTLIPGSPLELDPLQRTSRVKTSTS